MTAIDDVGRRAMRSARVLGHLSDDAAAALIEAGWSMTYAAGTAVYRHDEPLDAVLIVLQGRIDKTQRTGHGRPIVVGQLSSGDVDGELAVLAGAARGVDATAVDDVEALLLYRRDMLAALANSPGALQAVVTALAGELVGATSAHMDGAIRARAAVAAALIRLAGQHGRPLPDGILIDLALSQTGLAAHAGIERSAASRELGALRDLGLVRAENGGKAGGMIVLLDRDALQDYADVTQA